MNVKSYLKIISKSKRHHAAVLFLNGKSCSSQTGPVCVEGSEERGTSKRNRETRVRLVLNNLEPFTTKVKILILLINCFNFGFLNFSSVNLVLN